MILYKYFHPTRRNFFQDMLVRFTQPSQFNDPFDCCPQFQGSYKPEFYDQLLKKGEAAIRETRHFDLLPPGKKKLMEDQMTEIRVRKLKEYTTNPEIAQGIHLNLLVEKISREIGIFCLSKCPDSVTMWSHYADEHRGFVVGFDTETEFFSKRPAELGEIGELRKVEYSNIRPAVILPFSDESPEVDFLFTKDLQWELEQEWRILRFLKDADAQSIIDRSVYLFNVPPDSIKNVIFGSRADTTKEPLIRSALKIILNNPDLRHIQIQKAVLSTSAYALKIRDFPF